MMATKAEIAGIMAVMEAAFDPAFGEAWTERQLASALLVPGTRFALIDAMGVIGPPSPGLPTAGFYLSRQILDEEELLLIAVIPGQRGKGIASRLIEHLLVNAAERGARRIFLEMREDNPAAQLYAKYGFEQIGLRPAYYKGADGTSRAAKTMAMPTGLRRQT